MLEFFGAPEYSVPPLPLTAPEAVTGKIVNDTNNITVVPFNILTGALPSPVGSCLVEYGNTKVIAIVNGPYPLPKSQQEASKAILRVRVLPSAVCFEAMASESIQKTKLSSSILEDILKVSFESVIILDRHPRMAIELDVHILGDHGDVLMAATIACSAALSQSQVQMLDLLIGLSISNSASKGGVKLEGFQNSINITYAPTLCKYASIYGMGAFQKNGFQNIDATVKEQANFITKLLKKSLLSYADANK